MWIKNIKTGIKFKYGRNKTDCLRVSEDGTHLIYENQYNGETSEENGNCRFVTDERGLIPSDDAELKAVAGQYYFNVGGFSLGSFDELALEFLRLSELKESYFHKEGDFCARAHAKNVYSVRCDKRKFCCVIRAKNPHDAIRKVINTVKAYD